MNIIGFRHLSFRGLLRSIKVLEMGYNHYWYFQTNIMCIHSLKCVLCLARLINIIQLQYNVIFIEAVFCTDAPSLLDFGPIQIVCVVTTTSFSMINVTFKESYGADSLLISRIKSDGSIIDTITNDNIVISYALSIVTIAIYNVSCPYNGFYGVSVDSVNNLTGRAEWQLSVKGIKIVI